MIKHPTDVKVKDVKQYTLKGFRGVDFTTSPLLVSEQRSPDAKNWVYENGSPSKRPGWKQVAYVADANINGMYEYEDNKLLVYAGKKFYTVELTETGVGYMTTEIEGFTGTYDRKVQFFKQDDRVFIVGTGEFLVWHKIGTPTAVWTLEQVNGDNTITHIPTTTISIDELNFEGASLQAALERPNLLTTWRINTCRGVVGSADSIPAYTWFQLDGNAIVSNTDGSDVIAYVTIVYKDIAEEPNTLELLGFYKLVEPAGVKIIELRESYAGVTVYGRIFESGMLELDGQVTEPITIEDNITVKYRAYNGSELDITGSTMINDAQFGILFGVDGVTTQLFVAGGEDTPNVDYYSYPLDFTYFPDNFYRAVGNSPIKGYLRIGDGSLVIFKEKSYGEAAIFLRTGTLETVATEDYYNAEIAYTEKAGYADEYLTSRDTIDTLAGDPLYTSINGVKGIVLSENVSTDERFARRRSYFVDAKLKDHDLESAIAFTYKGKYYLCVDDVCFIADSSLAVGNYPNHEYEWQYWDNVPARIFAEIQYELWFGTDDGRLCKFDTAYTDRSFEVVDSTDLSYHPADDNVVYNSALEIEERNKIKFSNDKMHELVMDSTTCDNDDNLITATSASAKARVLIMNEFEEMLLVDQTDDTNVTVFAQNVDNGAYSFELVNELGVAVDMSGYTNYALVEPLIGVELYIKDLDDEEHTFKLARNSDTDAISLVYYDNDASPLLDDVTEVNVGAIVITTTNVTAHWYSSVANLGSSVMAKTLLSLTLVATGAMAFGYTTRFGDLAKEFEKAVGFDFTDMDFTNFTFTAFMESMTKKVKERNINFVMFQIISDNGKTASIHELSARFIYNNMNRGVR